jgi:hypothetical protein
VYSIGFILLAFIIYQSLAETPLLPKLTGWPARHNTQVLFSRITGCILLGLTGLILDAQNIYSVREHLVTPEFTGSLYWILLGIAFVIVFNILFTKPGEDDKYPQLQYHSWNAGHILLNSLTWLIYLFSYEWLLRGPLLNELVSLTGVYAGVAINTIIYSLIHIVKGRKEMIASIPVGIALCAVTLYMHSFLAAFIFHGAFALSYEYVLLYRRSAVQLKSAQQ